ncbi:MAG: BACON domain-containing protein, partial [Proteiniphilum sp.]|nr:BACON domain-containing protein [Proteiniphilum sp.]
MKKSTIQIVICFFAILMLGACKEESVPVFNVPADEIANLTPFSAAGEIKSITVEASGNVTATSDQPDWCIPTYAYRHNLLFFDVKPNEGTARTAVVTVQSEGFPDITVPISQLGAPPSLSVT